MRLEASGVRIADVETCDFGLMDEFDTPALLHAVRPAEAEQYLTSAVARRLVATLGVERRYLTQLPGLPATRRLNAFDLARSAVERLQARRAGDLARLDALIFVSTSNPNPCNSQAALLAEACGITASCMDLKAGCSGGVLGLVQAALLVRSGCGRVLVVMAENLSQLTPVADLRMLLTMGDGAACVLLERAPDDGPGFRAMLHGTEPALSGTMTVSKPFPPVAADGRYEFEFHESGTATAFMRDRWRALFRESLAAAGLTRDDLGFALFHQTHRAQVDDLAADLRLSPAQMPVVVGNHGNMGTPTFAVALAQVFRELAPGQRYLLQAVGGGVGWCSIVAEHG